MQLPPSFPTHLCVSKALRLCACLFVNNSWCDLCALSPALFASAHARDPHEISQTITPTCARRLFVWIVWTACVSLAHRFIEWTHVSGSTFACCLWLGSCTPTCCRTHTQGAHAPTGRVAVVIVVGISLTLSLTLTPIKYALCASVVAGFPSSSITFRVYVWKVQRLWGLR